MSLDLDPDALGGLHRERAKSLPVYFTRRCYL